jgi:hypothetical protein
MKALVLRSAPVTPVSYDGPVTICEIEAAK